MTGTNAHNATNQRVPVVNCCEAQAATCDVPVSGIPVSVGKADEVCEDPDRPHARRCDSHADRACGAGLERRRVDALEPEADPRGHEHHSFYDTLPATSRHPVDRPRRPPPDECADVQGREADSPHELRMPAALVGERRRPTC
jgi:hypothetical protein